MMRFACTACASPAVSLPPELFDDALVHCQGCNKPIATWAAFKRRTTQVILAEIKQIGTGVAALSPDPLDASVLQSHKGGSRLPI
jgi:hypothetical protein